MGNRRYRVIVQAVPDNGVDAALFFSAREKYGQDLAVSADMDGDGQMDAEEAVCERGDGHVADPHAPIV